MAEADFSFGDGVVESIEVPCIGDGFNVGVKWDDSQRGGPPWPVPVPLHPAGTLSSEHRALAA